MRRAWFTSCAASAFVVAAATGCHTLSPITTPGEYVSTKQPESVWITQNDHSILQVHGPHMVGDTVVGDVRNRYTKIPLSDIAQLAVSRSAPGKTLALAVAGGVVVIGGAVLMFAHHGQGTAPNTCLTPNSFDDICGGPSGGGGQTLGW